jgi:pyruvate dehydrogenase E2 component (dihydrolipoamide acetyltransferase)
MAEFRMPSLGADMETGTVIEWRVKPGDRVERGDIVAVVKTDKSDIEVETFSGGVVEEIVVPVGDEVSVGTVLARIGAAEAAPAPRRVAPPTVAEPAPARGDVRGAGGVGAPTIGPPLVTVPHPVLSPIVRHLAEHAGVDIARVAGTGPGGLVTRADVEAAVAAALPPPAGPVTAGAVHPRASPRARRLAAAHGIDLRDVRPRGGAITGDDVEHAALAPALTTPGGPTRAEATSADAARRRAVAELMARSKREIPHYYLSTTIDLGTVLDWLELENASRPVTGRLLPAALLLKATARAAAQVPEVNGFWADGKFRPEREVHLGVAVSLRGGGLLAPAIRCANELPLDELMARLRAVVMGARSGALRSSAMSMPTITVTNLGDQGVESVFGVIYPPQVALVGFGRVVQRPWAINGLLGARPTVVATLSADHRASDGHIGARFLSLIDRLLQEPNAL